MATRDLEQPGEATDPGDPGNEARLRLACEALERGLRAGLPARCEEAFEACPALADDPDRALDLIYLEYAVRGELGPTPDREEYYARFPRWREHLERQFAFDELVIGQDTEADAAGTTARGDVGPREGGESGSTDPDSSRRYVPLRPLARGGIGEVWVALDTELNREVALKEIREPLADHPESRGRFEVEAEVTGRLEHPGVVPVHGFGRDRCGRPYYAMRLIRGETLQEAIRRLHGDGAPVGPRAPELRRLLRRFLEVCNTVAYAHSRGVIHRDLKPANILLGPYGETLVVDWGVAKLLGGKDRPGPGPPGEPKPGADEVSRPQGGRNPGPGADPSSATRGETTLRIGADFPRTEAGAAIGTPAFMSPEQASGDVEAVGPASDVYSLGATLFTLLTGRSSVEGDNAPEALQRARRGEVLRVRVLNPEIPPALEAICRKAMGREPAGRYATPLQLAEDLERWLDDDPVSAYRDPLGARVSRWARRNWAWVRVAVLASLVVGVVSLSALLAVELARRHAEEQRVLALSERAAADRQRDQARRQAARLVVDRASALHDRGRFGEAMVWLVRALEGLPAGDPLRLVIRTNLHAWQGRVIRRSAELDGGGPVASAAVSPDGRAVLTVDRDGTARVHDAATARPRGPALASPARIRVACFGPGGRTVLAGCGDRKARIWDASDGQPIGPVFDHGAGIECVAFAPDGRRLVTGGGGRPARLWDAATGTIVTTFDEGGPARAAAFTPDGKAVLLRSGEKSARLCAADGGRALATFWHLGPINVAVLSPDGRYALTASDARTAKLWDTADGAMLANMSPSGRVRAAVFSPDARTLLLGCTDGTAQLWTVPEGKPIGPPLKHQESVLSTAFSPDGRVALTGSFDGTARLWRVADGMPLGEPMQHDSFVSMVACPGDGNRLLTCAGDGRARLWDRSPGSDPKRPWDDQGAIITVAYGPDGRVVATGCRSGIVRLRSALSGEPLGEPIRHQGLIKTLTFRPDGRALLSGSDDRTARLWDPATGRPLGPPMEHGDRVIVALFVDRGRSILTADRTGTVRHWGNGTGRPTLPAKLGSTTCGAASAGGRHAAIGTASETALLDGASGRVLGRVAHRGRVRDVEFDPGGRVLMTASDDGTARFWEVPSLRPLGEVMRHSGQVWSVAFAPDGRVAASAGMDATARLWSVPSGLPLGEPLRVTKPVMAVTFDPRGRWLLTGCPRFSQLWHVPTGLPVGLSSPHRGGFWELPFSPDGRRVLTDHLWDAPTPLPDRPDLLISWAGLATQRTLADDNTVRWSDPEELHSAARSFAERAGRPWTEWPAE